ncbi:DUF262 domain-containing protein [Microbacterium thalassium]|uniref:DUF262 domain-containing protein n=1 Tax=Microbacterium thalassium TaxID=362649 RepID=A0A7X0FRW6_9MICO|nr:DUF262 domain-containing protein [Microbacterium thalassium]MBB6391972.1 hypothetical protein [Microbacterium thalassium]GLK23992.1 hypothetical protein GCM10017607_13100 [Microbacterium thalassium]
MVTALTATNVDATAVNTIGWLASGEWTIVVPVYQRQYRWDIGGCEQLLGDIRAVAELDDRRMHFIGSVLSAVSPGADGDELVLIDGQQRMTTLMLLVAALSHTVRASDPELAAELERVLERPSSAGRTKLRPHRAWADVFERVVLDLPAPDASRASRFDDNYAFFRSQISAAEAPRIWRGLQKLEHVAITLGAGANAQQIFESLNSTGEPLRDHELIHNYVLMGLSHAQQREIEDDYWLPIERSTGESIAAFWRQYLVMHTGREVSVTGGRGVYDVFRQEFPLLEIDDLRGHASDWRAFAAVYRILLEPATALDDEVGRHLAYLNTFGSTIYPLVMRAYRDHELGLMSRDRLIELLEMLQSMLLRRAAVAVNNDRLVARLCRAYDDGHEALVTAISRVTPSDDRVRVALKYTELVHPEYVLGRLAGAEPGAQLDVDHIVPAAPSDAWTADGAREWGELTEDEQNSFRAVAKTLGNLTLLEEELAAQAFDRSFPDKTPLYGRSGLPLTRDLAGLPDWSTARIAARSAELTKRFVQVWPRTGGRVIDDDGLTPILDAVRRRGWPRGWQREWSYVEYRGEHWEVPDVKYLFNRIFKRLWADSRASVVSYSARRGGPVYTAPSWNGQWDRLDDDNHLYMGWDYSYMLAAVQGVLQEAGIESEVFVKYSYIGEAM